MADEILQKLFALGRLHAQEVINIPWVDEDTHATRVRMLQDCGMYDARKFVGIDYRFADRKFRIFIRGRQRGPPSSSCLAVFG